MSSLSSEVEICNMALGWLGADRITSLTDDSEQANLCNLNYATSRDTVLESREWTFAVKRFSLTPTGVTPEYDWAYEFVIPTEVLRVLTVDRPTVGLLGSSENEQEDWVREGNSILMNRSTLTMRAIIRVVNTTLFSASFVHVLAARLASDLAIPITRSKALQQQMYALYGAKLEDAAKTDGMQGRSKRIRSRYLSARR